MAQEPQASLKADTVEVEDLVQFVRSGRIRIPAFQRGLRWTHADVERLFESIQLGYPIGNLLMWERSAEAGTFPLGAMTVSASQSNDAWFVVDGQQRLTALANALSVEGLNDSRFQLAFDLVREKFVRYRSETTATEVPLPTLFDLNSLIMWFARHRELAERSDLLERATGVAKAIRQFKVPVYVVRNSDETVLRDIFDRMNNFGKKLTRAEVFSALSIAQHGEKSGTDHGSYADIAERLDAGTGFGVIDDQTVFACFLARRGPDITREIRAEFQQQGDRDVIDVQFVSETPTEALEQCESSMRTAIEFLQEDAGIPHFAFLPYRYLLIVLTRFFAHYPTPTSATVRDLRRWVWRAAAGGPGQFKGSATGATRALAKKIVGSERESVEGLLDLTGTSMVQAFQLGAFNTSNADTRIALCALWSVGPMQLIAERAIPTQRSELSDALGEASSANSIFPHVVARSSLGESNRRAPGARVLDPRTDIVIGGSVATEFRRLAEEAQDGSDAARAVLDSHLVSPEISEILLEGSPDQVVEMRSVLVREAVTSFLYANAEWDVKTIPPVTSFEVADDDDSEFSMASDGTAPPGAE